MKSISLAILIIFLGVTTSAVPLPSSPQTSLSLGALRFDWPISDAIITSPFGYRNDVSLVLGRGGGDSIHLGLDLIPAKATRYSVEHTKIFASEAGEAWVVFPPPGTPIPGSKRTFAGHPVFGGCVLIRHLVGHYGNRSIYAYTLYGHMREVWITEKTTVKKGDSIGLMGTTGESTGAHVHFEILFDPMDFLLITAGARQEEDAIRAASAQAEEYQRWMRKNGASYSY